MFVAFAASILALLRFVFGSTNYSTWKDYAEHPKEPKSIPLFGGTVSKGTS